MNINDVKNIIAYNASSIPVLFEMCRIAKVAETINNKEKQALEKETKHIGKKAFACAEGEKPLQNWEISSCKKQLVIDITGSHEKSCTLSFSVQTQSYLPQKFLT